MLFKGGCDRIVQTAMPKRRRIRTERRSRAAAAAGILMKKRNGYDGGRRKRKARIRKLLLALVSMLLAAVLGFLCVILWHVWQPVTIPVLPEGLQQEAGNQVSQTEEETWAVTEAPEDGGLKDSSNEAINAANRLARMYDYEGARAAITAIPGYETDEECQAALAVYEDLEAQCVPWERYDQITHIFFHILTVDEELAYSSDNRDNYNQVMTTVDEFKQIIQSMYEKGYVLISLHKIAKMELQPDGTEKMVKQEIRLPKGKKPFVLSEDDVCYYEYMEGEGFATKLCLDENGKVVNEYVNRDGSVSYGAYDVLPILEEFIEEHPDFSYQGSKGILAFTGYNGVLGYRTSDFWYAENCDYYISDEKNDRLKQTEYSWPNLNIEQDKQTAKQVAQAIRDLGWEMASHSWGHINMKKSDISKFVWDTDLWEREVEPIIGETDILLYPFGADVGEWMASEYGAQNERYMKLKSVGFNYFCNVDSAQYWVQIGDSFFRQGRRNMDGQMMYKQIVYPQKLLTGDLFDAETVFSKNRPVPVPGVTLPESETQTQAEQ